jgi:hypothetical protein
MDLQREVVIGRHQKKRINVLSSSFSFCDVRGDDEDKFEEGRGKEVSKAEIYEKRCFCCWPEGTAAGVPDGRTDCRLNGCGGVAAAAANR